MMRATYPGNDHTYPNFNDTPHDRPILSEDGLSQAAQILLGILLGIAGLALILTIV
jgi:hypothetical protein